MKLRTLAGLFSMALFMTACHSNSYKIEGTAEGFSEGDTLFVSNDKGLFTDTMIVHDNKFELSGEVDSVAIFVISSQSSYTTVPFFKEPGTIKVLYSADGISKVSGTKTNDICQKFHDMEGEYAKKGEALFKNVNLEELSEEERIRYFEQYQQLQSEYLSKVVESAEQNIDNEFGYFLVCNLPISDNGVSAEKVLELIDKMPADFKERQQTVMLKAEINGMIEFKEGKPFADFSLPTPEGTEMSVLEQVKQHKITLIDFWASWCGPCRQEMPNLVSLYAKYKEKGFYIVGVSLDENHDDWVEAIKKLEMTWPQVSDLKGWQSAPAQQYQVKAIPYTILVDNKGTIIAKELRGAGLEKFLEAYFR